VSDYLVKAIKRLRPGAEFSIIDSDLDRTTWDVLEGEPPTAKEVADAIKAIQADEANEAAEKAARRAEILERLGLTEDEAKLILG
jgi:hypothetical protein